MNAANKLNSTEMKSLLLKIFTRLPLLLLFMCVFILLPAGTLDFWQVYVYFAVLVCPMVFVVLYFLKKDPKFLERRMRVKEKEKQQRLIIFTTSLLYIGGYILTGLDYRFGWSDIPTVIVIIADLLVFLSYMFIVLVFKVNSFASRIVETEANQKVISSGPYSIIRHPMYTGMMLMMLATPIALGSYWALIPFAFIPLSLAFRILNEEKVLTEQLQDYTGYCMKVRYRLIPFVW